MRQPPGGIALQLRYGSGTIFVRPDVTGTFEIEYAQSGLSAGPPATLNRSELAALHAAIGELLAFYRNHAPEEPPLKRV